MLTDINNGGGIRGGDRTIEAGNKVLEKTFSKDALKNIELMVSDMSGAYINVGKNKLLHATQAADPFHLIKMLNEAIDKTRKQELKPEKGLLTDSRFALLKRPENLTDRQKLKFQSVDKANLRTARVWRARANFRTVFNQPDPPPKR